MAKARQENNSAQVNQNLGPTGDKSQPFSEAKLNEGFRREARAWAKLSGSQVCSPEEYLELKQQRQLHVVGITGFYEEWSAKNLIADRDTFAMSLTAEVRIDWALTDLKEQFGRKLVVATRGGGEGVAAIVRDLCERRGIKHIGIASGRPKSDGSDNQPPRIVLAGEKRIDESDAIVGLSNQLLVFGGGVEAKFEAQKFAAKNSYRDITVYKLFGGPAGDLSGGELHAMFVTC
jgi:hypothetical protein